MCTHCGGAARDAGFMIFYVPRTNSHKVGNNFRERQIASMYDCRVGVSMAEVNTLLSSKLLID